MVKACLYNVALACLAALFSGCASFGYYLQSVQGQLEVLQKSVPIETFMQKDDISADIHNKLQLALELREFAVRELLLPANKSYQSYADLDRDYVLWNVFAAPELSLESTRWCYLFIGCLNYRGYFSEADARHQARQLQAMGHDVFVGGVAAYSTLGWFSDPVLNTMLRHNDIYLARVIFHELGHQLIFIRNDTEFNEAFADSIAETGVQRWLQSRPVSEQNTFHDLVAQEDEFAALVLRYRQALDELYRSNLTEQEKRQGKHEIFTDMQSQYQTLKTNWNHDTKYDAWFADGLNNAKLLAVATYRRFLPGFRILLDSVDQNLQAYYALVTKLGKCTREQRHHILISGLTAFTCDT